MEEALTLRNCAVLNPRRDAKWENQLCELKVGYIHKKENSTLDPFIPPSGMSSK